MGFDCHECDDQLKKERGCTERGIVPFYIGEETYYKCPLKLITPMSMEYVRAFSFYQKAILPHDQGWTKESKKYLDAMIALENEVSRLEQEKMKKLKK